MPSRRYAAIDEHVPTGLKHFDYGIFYAAALKVDLARSSVYHHLNRAGYCDALLDWALSIGMKFHAVTLTEMHVSAGLLTADVLCRPAMSGEIGMRNAMQLMDRSMRMQGAGCCPR